MSKTKEWIIMVLLGLNLLYSVASFGRMKIQHDELVTVLGNWYERGFE